METNMKLKYIKSILENSVEKKSFIIAILEWKFIYECDIDAILLTDDIEGEHDNCICGHSIRTAFIIQNIHNGKKLINGCDCIDKLKDIPLNYELKMYKNMKKKLKKFEKKLNKFETQYQNKQLNLFNNEKNNVTLNIEKWKNSNMTFGKFKGVCILQIPNYYLKWYIRQRQVIPSFAKNTKLDDMIKFKLGVSVEPIIQYLSDSD